MATYDGGKASRDELLRLLGEAADLEHSLMCQYLFAAYSLKREGVTAETADDDQLTLYGNWARFILMVARQEMEHLGLVCNLLSAVGGAPTFGLRRFPYTSDLYGHQMALEPFSRDTIRKFICFERPQDVEPKIAYCMLPSPTRSVGDLYERIRALLGTLDGPTLFVGAVADEITGVDIGTDFPRVGGLGGGYDVFLSAINELPSALAAIDLILAQGEGTGSGGDEAHFQIFCEILDQLEAHPDLQPALPVVANPSLTARPGTTQVTHPTTRAVMALFDAAYRTTLQVLARLWSGSGETPAQRTVLQQLAFMPLMTMAIRPLAEILMSMPAHEVADGVNAGPSFDAGGSVAVVPHRAAAWMVLGEGFEALAANAAQVASLPDSPPRLAYVAHTLELMAARFAAGMKVS